MLHLSVCLRAHPVCVRVSCVALPQLRTRFARICRSILFIFSGWIERQVPEQPHEHHPVSSTSASPAAAAAGYDVSELGRARLACGQQVAGDRARDQCTAGQRHEAAHCLGRCWRLCGVQADTSIAFQ